MNKTLLRVIAVLLVPCLLLSSVPAFSLAPIRRSSAPCIRLFEQQALNPVALWTGAAAIARRLTGRDRRGFLKGAFGLEYADGLEGYDRVHREENRFSWDTFFAENQNETSGDGKPASADAALGPLDVLQRLYTDIERLTSRIQSRIQHTSQFDPSAILKYFQKIQGAVIKEKSNLPLLRLNPKETRALEQLIEEIQAKTAVSADMPLKELKKRVRRVHTLSKNVLGRLKKIATEIPSGSTSAEPAATSPAAEVTATSLADLEIARIIEGADAKEHLTVLMHPVNRKRVCQVIERMIRQPDVFVAELNLRPTPAATDSVSVHAIELIGILAGNPLDNFDSEMQDRFIDLVRLVVYSVGHTHILVHMYALSTLGQIVRAELLSGGPLPQDLRDQIRDTLLRSAKQENSTSELISLIRTLKYLRLDEIVRTYLESQRQHPLKMVRKAIAAALTGSVKPLLRFTSAGGEPLAITPESWWGRLYEVTLKDDPAMVRGWLDDPANAHYVEILRTKYLGAWHAAEAGRLQHLRIYIKKQIAPKEETNKYLELARAALKAFKTWDPAESLTHEIIVEVITPLFESMSADHGSFFVEGSDHKIEGHEDLIRHERVKQLIHELKAAFGNHLRSVVSPAHSLFDFQFDQAKSASEQDHVTVNDNAREGDPLLIAPGGDGKPASADAAPGPLDVLQRLFSAIDRIMSRLEGQERVAVEHRRDDILKNFSKIQAAVAKASPHLKLLGLDQWERKYLERRVETIQTETTVPAVASMNDLHERVKTVHAPVKMILERLQRIEAAMKASDSSAVKIVPRRAKAEPRVASIPGSGVPVAALTDVEIARMIHGAPPKEHLAVLMHPVNRQRVLQVMGGMIREPLPIVAKLKLRPTPASTGEVITQAIHLSCVITGNPLDEFDAETQWRFVDLVRLIADSVGSPNILLHLSAVDALSQFVRAELLSGGPLPQDLRDQIRDALLRAAKQDYSSDEQVVIIHTLMLLRSDEKVRAYLESQRQHPRKTVRTAVEDALTRPIKPFLRFAAPSAAQPDPPKTKGMVAGSLAAWIYEFAQKYVRWFPIREFLMSLGYAWLAPIREAHFFMMIFEDIWKNWDTLRGQFKGAQTKTILEYLFELIAEAKIKSLRIFQNAHTHGYVGIQKIDLNPKDKTPAAWQEIQRIRTDLDTLHGRVFLKALESVALMLSAGFGVEEAKYFTEKIVVRKHRDLNITAHQEGKVVGMADQPQRPDQVAYDIDFVPPDQYPGFITALTESLRIEELAMAAVEHRADVLERRSDTSPEEFKKVKEELAQRHVTTIHADYLLSQVRMASGPATDLLAVFGVWSDEKHRELIGASALFYPKRVRGDQTSRVAPLDFISSAYQGHSIGTLLRIVCFIWAIRKKIYRHFVMRLDRSNEASRIALFRSTAAIGITPEPIYIPGVESQTYLAELPERVPLDLESIYSSDEPVADYRPVFRESSRPTWPEQVELSGSEIAPMATLAFRMVRHLHEGRYQTLVCSSRSSYLPYTLLQAAWMRLYPEDPFPQLIHLGDRANTILYKGDDYTNDQRRALVQKAGLLDLQGQRVCFIDDVSLSAYKFRSLRRVFRRLGLENIDFAFLGMNKHPSAFATPRPGALFAGTTDPELLHVIDVLAMASANGTHGLPVEIDKIVERIHAGPIPDATDMPAVESYGAPIANLIQPASVTDLQRSGKTAMPEMEELREEHRLDKAYVDRLLVESGEVMALIAEPYKRDVQAARSRIQQANADGKLHLGWLDAAGIHFNEQAIDDLAILIWAAGGDRTPSDWRWQTARIRQMLKDDTELHELVTWHLMHGRLRQETRERLLRTAKTLRVSKGGSLRGNEDLFKYLVHLVAQFADDTGRERAYGGLLQDLEPGKREIARAFYSSIPLAHPVREVIRRRQDGRDAQIQSLRAGHPDAPKVISSPAVQQTDENGPSWADFRRWWIDNRQWVAHMVSLRQEAGRNPKSAPTFAQFIPAFLARIRSTWSPNWVHAAENAQRLDFVLANETVLSEALQSALDLLNPADFQSEPVEKLIRAIVELNREDLQVEYDVQPLLEDLFDTPQGRAVVSAWLRQPIGRDRDRAHALIAELAQVGRDAGAYLQEKRIGIQAELKEAINSYVTKSDYDVQRMVFERILGDPRFADVYIDAEEDLEKAGIAPQLIQRNRDNFGKATFVLSVDPLDGTNIYKDPSAGPDYCFAATLLYNGHPVYTVILAPEANETYEANALTHTATWNGRPLNPSWEPLHAPPRIIGKGSHSQGIPHPLRAILPAHFNVTEKADAMILQVARMARREPSLSFDAITSATNPAHDSISSAGIIHLTGGKTVRPDGSPIFPIRWEDLTPEARNRVPFIAGGPVIVDHLVGLHRDHLPGTAPKGMTQLRDPRGFGLLHFVASMWALSLLGIGLFTFIYSRGGIEPTLSRTIYLLTAFASDRNLVYFLTGVGVWAAWAILSADYKYYRGVSAHDVLEELNYHGTALSLLAVIFLHAFTQNYFELESGVLIQMNKWWTNHGADIFGAYMWPAGVGTILELSGVKLKSRKAELAMALLLSGATFGGSYYINHILRMDRVDFMVEQPLNLVWFVLNWARIYFKYNPRNRYFSSGGGSSGAQSPHVSQPLLMAA